MNIHSFLADPKRARSFTVAGATKVYHTNGSLETLAEILQETDADH
jgi:hypothetical protein